MDNETSLFPRADMLVSEELRFLERYCSTLAQNGESTILTYIAFTGLENHANREWLASPRQFNFKDGTTLADFNKQLLANRSRELANLELALTPLTR
ncbi:MAG: hypothetical protein AAB927_02340 [Patescibacteria group bacterium]